MISAKTNCSGSGFRKQLYFSPLGPAIAFALGLIGRFYRPFMIYGFYNRVQKQFQRFTRISSSSVLTNRQNLDIQDHTWIGHFSIIDGSAPVTIGLGCQLAAWVGVYTHSSHHSIRLLGEHYLDVSSTERPGYVCAPVNIGAFTFIGAQCVILPGANIGRGCIIAAQSVVKENVPDFAIVRGNPARIIGDTREVDTRYLVDPTLRSTFYAPELLDSLTAAPNNPRNNAK
jgi:acetyltransferase-like isoleucine patch superfamily enzyme